MASKVLRNLIAAASVVAATYSLSLMIAAPAYSVHDVNVFELDGNTGDGVAGGEDWSTALFGPLVNGQLAKTGVVSDPAPKSIFTGGGSKDDLDLNGPLSGAGGWKFKDGAVPDKDDITNAYAVAYNSGGKLVIYAGADRFDNSGDAFMGFWFFQNQVGLPAGATSGNFVGQHAVGDVLVLANFTGGGTTVNIEVLKWVGSGGNVNGTLQRIAGVAGGTPATCNGGLSNDLFCGITNSAPPETPPWPYLSKSGTSSFPAATFMEIGINISDVFAAANAGAVPCFSSFMAETRSSSSVNATLKDFVAHAFPVCGIAVSKQCINPVLASNSTVGYTVQGQIQNTGFGTLTNIALTDAPRPLGAVSYVTCDPSGNPTQTPAAFSGSLKPLQSVCYRSSFTTPVNGEDDTITATANAGSATVTAQATADCPNLQLSPALKVTKQCTAVLAGVAPYLVVKINVAGDVTNIGDAPLSNVALNDTDVGAIPLIGGNTLALNETKSFTASYYPSSADNRLQPGSSTFVPGLAKFSDTVTATASAPLNASVQPQTATAECTLCPTCSPDVCAGGVCPASQGVTSSSLIRKR